MPSISITKPEKLYRRPRQIASIRYQTDLLLKAQRTQEAHTAVAALRDEFKGSELPNLRYLRHYCTHQLSLLSRSSGLWSYEAQQANSIKCSASL